MAKYLVETYYTCSFKVSHYLDKVDEKELSNLENRDDGKFEIIDVKLDTRKTKSLEKNQKNPINREIEKLQKETQVFDEAYQRQLDVLNKTNELLRSEEYGGLAWAKDPEAKLVIKEKLKFNKFFVFSFIYI